jgi:hypothetical protein
LFPSQNIRDIKSRRVKMCWAFCAYGRGEKWLKNVVEVRGTDQFG